MARLPTPGGDDGTWGTVLNDFLQQAHEADGTLSDGVATGAVLGSDVTKTTSLIRAGFPTATQIPAGQWAIYKDSTNGTLRVWANDAGTLKSAPLVSGGVSGLITLNVLDFGADPTGTANSGLAIQAAIDALPIYGGVVYIPPGNYRVNASINIGNGSATTESTRTGVILQGGIPAGVQVWSQPHNVSGVLAQGNTRLFTANAIVMINVQGPLQGWGMSNLHLDGQEVGLAGVDEISAIGGVCSDMVITRFTLFGQRCRSRDGDVGGMSVAGANHTRNRYANYSFKVPGINGAKAVIVEGNGVTLTTDAWGDTWDKVNISFSSPPPDGVTVYGFYLKGCDSILVRDLYMGAGGDTTGTGKYYGIAFDYNNEWARHPANCIFDNVDFGNSRQTTGVHPVLSTGTAPLAGVGQVNKIYNVCQFNGTLKNPNLANLVWEHQYPKLSLAVTSTAMTLEPRLCQYKVMEFTGVLSANTTITVDFDSGHEYIIKNGTTGAFTLTIQGPSGAGVVVGTGKRAFLYGDGANIVRISADV